MSNTAPGARGPSVSDAGGSGIARLRRDVGIAALFAAAIMAVHLVCPNLMTGYRFPWATSLARKVEVVREAVEFHDSVGVFARRPLMSATVRALAGLPGLGWYAAFVMGAVLQLWLAAWGPQAAGAWKLVAGLSRATGRGGSDGYLFPTR